MSIDANMCTFAIALVLSHQGTISLEGFIHNLVPVTLGNLVGGVLLMGVMYYYTVNRPFLDEIKD
ncbi:formate/nitrite transporter FocA (FNT family) [Paenibacillus brasilensis]|uniref:Formate/nitrite transporter FocA (FNT family) n=1 Tax=Paenibacillus brasilensis TaxID=128574 RepID=A0ABU0L0U5_9BACL|nr:formate/nitrite transporter FocA (FNT family) [Paenibacillus brasilensis]